MIGIPACRMTGSVIRRYFQEVFLLKKKKPFSELVIGLACIVLGVAVFIAAGSLQKVRLGIGPGGFPRFIGVVLAVLGAAQSVLALSSGIEAPKFNIEKKSASLTLFCLLAYFAILGIRTIAFSGVTTDNFMGT